MSTRSCISKRYKDGKISAIYSHSDGYVEYVGRILYQHYNSNDIVDQLIDGGDLSILRENIGQKHNFDNIYNMKYDDLPQVKNEWTTFYKRDRGEANVDAHVCSSWKEFAELIRNGWWEYCYLYDEYTNQWLWAVLDTDNLKPEQFNLLLPISWEKEEKSQQETTHV